MHPSQCHAPGPWLDSPYTGPRSGRRSQKNRRKRPHVFLNNQNFSFCFLVVLENILMTKIIKLHVRPVPPSLLPHWVENKGGISKRVNQRNRSRDLLPHTGPNVRITAHRTRHVRERGPEFRLQQREHQSPWDGSSQARKVPETHRWTLSHLNAL